MAFLHDPFWQFIIYIGVTLFVGIITVVISILLYRKQRRRKLLTYQIVSDTPVLSAERELADKVQVLFNGKPVDDARLVVLRLWNAGNESIKTEDYDQQTPIVIDFGENTEVLDAEILETSPASIKMRQLLSIASDIAAILLQPLLLNSKDSITVKVLLSRFTGTIQVNARIDGVKEILSYRPGIPRELKIVVIVACAVIILLLLFSFIYNSARYGISNGMLILLVFTSMSIVSIVFGVFLQWFGKYIARKYPLY